MKIATWNVNSLRVRLPHVLDWAATAKPDVIALQETKLRDDAFPAEELAAAGYRSVFSGQPTYNGVAILARSEPEDVVKGIEGFADDQQRVLGATVNGVRILNLYVPNGQTVESDKYQYKLRWLAALAGLVEQDLGKYEHFVALGDFNIAPEDQDVHDPEKWAGSVLVSEPERKALERLVDLGLTDVFRSFEQAEKSFSWWDYRAAAFRRNAGLRIDLILASRSLSASCSACSIDKEPRAWERPSDHVPVVADFEIE